MRGRGARGLLRARRGRLGAMPGLVLGAVLGALAGVGGEAWAQPRAVVGAEPSGEAVVLRVRWRAGQTVRYRVETSETPEGAHAARETTAVVSVQTVSVGAGGVATQRLRVESVRLAGVGTEGTGGALAGGLRAAEVRFRQDDRGEVTDTTLVGVPEAERARVGALVASLQQLGPSLPARALRVGDTWEAQSQRRVVPGPGGDLPLEIRRRYTLRALRSNDGGWLADLDTVATTRVAAGRAVGAIPLRAEGQSAGSVRYDLARGVVVEARARGDLQLEITVRGRPLRLRARVESNLRALPEGEAAAPVARPGRRHRARRRRR